MSPAPVSPLPGLSGVLYSKTLEFRVIGNVEIAQIVECRGGGSAKMIALDGFREPPVSKLHALR